MPVLLVKVFSFSIWKETKFSVLFFFGASNVGLAVATRPCGAVVGLLIKEAVAVIRRLFHSAAAVPLSRRPDPELFRLLFPLLFFLFFAPSLHPDQKVNG